MKTLALVVLGSLFVSCGGGGGVSSGGIPETEACAQAATTLCGKIFGCDDSADAFVKIVLSTQANCEAMVVQSCGATGFQCSAGATYHGDAAQVCKSEFNQQSCETVGAAISAGVTSGSTSTAIAGLTAKLPGCSKICTGGADGGTD